MSRRRAPLKLSPPPFPPPPTPPPISNVWFWRGMVEAGKFLRDVCGVLPACAPLAAQGPVLLDEAARFRADIEASLALSVTNNADGTPFFIPPIATVGMAPFKSMIESTLAEYSNFRYYSELLGADFLSPALSAALQEFRETHQGTVSGITRWSDHLDDMPSSYYMAAMLRDDRIPRALLLQYGQCVWPPAAASFPRLSSRG